LFYAAVIAEMVILYLYFFRRNDVAFLCTTLLDVLWWCAGISVSDVAGQRSKG